MDIITSKENRFVKEYCKLSASRRARKESNTFVVEGVRLTGEAAAAGALKVLFCTEEALSKYSEALSAALKTTPTQLLVSEPVAKKLADTEKPQGVFGIANAPEFSLELTTGKRYALLCGLQDPGNVGTVFRTAEALGLDGIFADNHCCDPLSPKAVRGSMGAVFRLPFAVLEDLSPVFEGSLPTYASVASGEAVPVTEVDFSSGGVLLIGNEGNGLPEDIVARCSKRITIPMAGKAESLNAAVAAGILLWEMCNGE